MKTTKYLCLLLLCVGAISCKQEKLDDSLLTFRLSGECLVDGPWDEPIPSGLSTDKLKITPLASEQSTGVLHFQFDTWTVQIADNEETEGIEFVIPSQVHEFGADNYSTGLSGEGILTEESIEISYRFWDSRYEGSAQCECHGERILED